LKWDEVGADVVVESTGLFLDEATAARTSRLARRRSSSSAFEGLDPMFVYGVNHEPTPPGIISNASSPRTASPVAKVINDAFGIKRGLMTRTRRHCHAEDGGRPEQQDWRGGAAPGNIIPSSTGAAKASAWSFRAEQKLTDGLPRPTSTCRWSI